VDISCCLIKFQTCNFSRFGVYVNSVLEISRGDGVLVEIFCTDCDGFER